ncbi:MAG: DUF4363 family protein [Acutalibacteraceae bacterium]
MKRLIPASIMIIFIAALCIYSNVYVNRACEQTVTDIEQYYENCFSNSDSTIETLSLNLENNWQKRKETLELFVNHSFLDKISLYIAQLPVLAQSGNETQFILVCENIKELTEQICEEQKFALHSFY